MINRVVLVGRLTKSPELKYTTNNIANLRFALAVNRSFKDQDGNQQADFIGCVAWRAQAENMARYLKKGSLIGVEGRIETGSYQAQDGTMRYTTDVVCDSIQYLEPKGDNNGNHAHPQENQFADGGGFDNNPYNTEASTKPSFNSTIDISDDDLPF